MSIQSNKIFAHRLLPLAGLLLTLFLATSYGVSATAESGAEEAADRHSDEHDDGHGEGGEHDEHEDEGHKEGGLEEGAHEEEGHVEVNAERAARAGIVLATAGSQSITESLRLYGRTEPDPQRVSHVRARYPGVIRTMGPALGEVVVAGDLIASVEGNDSLQRYRITAPIAGTVVERHANPGEFAGSEPLLTVADYSQLWVSLSVFPNEAQRIRPGQVVRLSAGVRTATSAISFLNPGRGERPSVVARLPLDNRDGQWTPGLLVEAEVIVAESAVPLAVDNRALQSVEGRQVVFVQEGDGFVATPLELGRRDPHYSEVLAGMSGGARYAVVNSYLLKAELEKSGASHAH